MNKIFEFLCHGSIIKTLRFNFHYFGFKGLFKPRFVIARNVKFGKLKGFISCPNKFAIVNFGFYKNKGYPLVKGRTFFSNNGSLIVKKHLCLGYGSSFSIESNAKVEINDCTIGCFSHIYIVKGLSIGDQVMISWNVQIMDTDIHEILDTMNNIINSPKEIRIGDNAWLCSRSIVLKNASIMKNCILASNSFISKPVDKENCIIANNKIIKENISIVG
jgi:acetyltransferase-like isoleucine patch superfamily enzyme